MKGSTSWINALFRGWSARRCCGHPSAVSLMYGFLHMSEVLKADLNTREGFLPLHPMGCCRLLDFGMVLRRRSGQSVSVGHTSSSFVELPRRNWAAPSCVGSAVTLAVFKSACLYSSVYNKNGRVGGDMLHLDSTLLDMYLVLVRRPDAISLSLFMHKLGDT